MDYKLNIKNIVLSENQLELNVSGSVTDSAISNGIFSQPKVVFFFNNGKENRRIPLVMNSVNYVGDKCFFSGKYTYKLDFIYWNTRKEHLPSEMTVNFSYGDFYTENAIFSIENEVISEDSSLYSFELKENKIVFSLKEKARRILLPSIIRIPLRLAFYFITFLIAFSLIPWFLLEAVLSFFDITKLDSKVKSPNPIRRIIGHVNQRVSKITTHKLTFKGIFKGFIILLYSFFKVLPIKQNRVTFISMRRTELSGNFEYVYNILKDKNNIDINFILCYNDSVFLPLSKTIQFCYACAVSKVIVLDEFTPQIHYINLRKETRLIQLWHACGAFKTFGFTRLGKPAGSPQNTKMHRSYDYVTVSSSYCKKCHSEGFGISDEKVVPTGIARTDVFFDENYKQKVISDFYERFPQLRDKKIILFAPTFRGDVKETANYPMDKFDIETVIKELGEEYAIIIKHHPFVSESHPIPAAYSDRVIDLSDNTELNDLLFVTDIIITDYSSLIFEAALLKIPMLFYVFDLDEYIRDRDFYFDLRLNSPGKLVFSQNELIAAIKKSDFETQRMNSFAEMFFDHFDGKSSERVANLIENALKE